MCEEEREVCDRKKEEQGATKRRGRGLGKTVPVKAGHPIFLQTSFARERQLEERLWKGQAGHRARPHMVIRREMTSLL